MWPGDISSRFSNDSEADTSELLEKFREIVSLNNMNTDICVRQVKMCSLNSRERVKSLYVYICWCSVSNGTACSNVTCNNSITCTTIAWECLNVV